MAKNYTGHGNSKFIGNLIINGISTITQFENDKEPIAKIKTITPSSGESYEVLDFSLIDNNSSNEISSLYINGHPIPYLDETNYIAKKFIPPSALTNFYQAASFEEFINSSPSIIPENGDMLIINGSLDSIENGLWVLTNIETGSENPNWQDQNNWRQIPKLDTLTPQNILMPTEFKVDFSSEKTITKNRFVQGLNYTDVYSIKTTKSNKDIVWGDNLRLAETAILDLNLNSIINSIKITFSDSIGNKAIEELIFNDNQSAVIEDDVEVIRGKDIEYGIYLKTIDEYEFGISSRLLTKLTQNEVDVIYTTIKIEYLGKEIS